MGRPANATLAWRGNPSRPFVRIRVGWVRKWIDLQRPDLREDRPEDEDMAWYLARKFATDGGSKGGA